MRKPLTIEEKLFLVARKKSKESHISVDHKLCRECLKRICLTICPAEVYKWDEEKSQVVVSSENCLECGSCWVACELDAIDWHNPTGGYGIKYKHG